MVAVGCGAAFVINVAEALALPPVPVHVRVYALAPVAVGISLAVPEVFCAPLHAPLALQEVAFVEDQVSVAV